MTNDQFGPRVFDELSKRALPGNVDLIDGGLAGLDLMRIIPGAKRVVFVDAIDGLAEGDPFVVMDGETVAAGASDHYGHSAGLPYLLRVLPEVLGSKLPEILVLGMRAQTDAKAIALAADRCLSLALEGSR
jgi:hydrogenase maturation protease